MDNISEMEVFVRVVQAESFSAAARQLNLSPSAVSKQVGRLEDRLGARLLNRTTRRLSLTEVGSAFYERSERIINDITEAEQAVSHLEGAARGTLKVNLPVAFGRLHVVPHLKEFLAAYPEVRIDLTLNDRFVDLVEEGVDIAIRIGELSDSSLIARKLSPNRRICVAAPSYIKAHGAPDHPEKLLEHNCLVYTYRAQRNDWPFEGPDGVHTIRVTGNLEANSAEVLRTSICDGIGIGLLPLWLISEDLEAGRVEQIMPAYHAPDSAIYAVYPHSRHLSPKVRSFVDFLVDKIKDLENLIKD